MPVTPRIATGSLCRRIEKLEHAMLVARRSREQLARRALGSLWPPGAERLLSALDAERQGRPLTSEEAAARHDYQEALARECRGAGYHSTDGFEDALNLHHLMIVACAQAMSVDDVELGIHALEAHAMGQEITQEESRALITEAEVWQRLARLAGCEVAAEAEEDQMP